MLSIEFARMWGTRALHFYQKEQIKRVRLVRRAVCEAWAKRVGYYVQFSINQERTERNQPTNRMLASTARSPALYLSGLASGVCQFAECQYLRRISK